METVRVGLDRKQALHLYREYKKHAAYSEPIDWEIQRTYQLLASGKVIIRAVESIKLAGLNATGLPKLALAPATATHCHICRWQNGSMTMGPTADRWRGSKNLIGFTEESFKFPTGSFPISRWNASLRTDGTDHRAAVPIIPIHLRPKRGLDNYHVLWEAEWESIVPRDPYLLRRIGKADLWLVVAHWDLTEVERAALATRVA